MLEDFNAGRLAGPPVGQRSLTSHVGPRCLDVGDVVAWRRIDDLEQARGRGSGRPRVKFTDVEGLRAATSGAALAPRGRRLARRA